MELYFLRTRNSYSMMLKVILLLFITVCVKDALGHGMMANPPGRSSVWRYYDGYPINWNDNEVYCGGGLTTNETFSNCGLCGDAVGLPRPRPNENTGTFGQGKVVATYTKGQVIDVSITLTTNHKGTFEYSLCELTNPATYEPDDDCFIPLELEDGSKSFIVEPNIKAFVNRVRLPENVSCDRCVLRWHYRAGNTWGQCVDGSYATGCGPQETFRSCADITIV